MRKQFVGAVLVLVVVILACSSFAVQAGTLTFTLGSATPSFTDGQKPIGTATFNTAVAANPAPFNGFIGSDISGPNFSGSWAYSYPAIAGSITAASLTLGLYDQDSAAPGNQVQAFTVGAVDLTATLNAALEAHGGATGEYDIYTIALPGTTFAALGGGTPSVSLTLQAPGLGVLGSTSFNGAGLDFSILTITTGGTTAVPEPSAWMLMATGIAAIVVIRYWPPHVASVPRPPRSVWVNDLSIRHTEVSRRSRC